MYRFSRIAASRLPMACSILLTSLGIQAQVSVRQVKVLGSKDVVEVEVEASERLTPQTRVLTGPDRLIVDFPNAIPGKGLRNQSVNRGEVKSLRVGLFQSKPPVTRVVLDLKSPQSFQLFPYGRTVMIKVVGGVPASTDDAQSQPNSRSGLINANYVVGGQPVVNPVPQPPPLDVVFRNGLLSIRADKSTLSEVLSAVQQRTGAQIAIAPGAEQEKVVVNLGPGPAADVIADLLHGSRFNFLILNAADDPSRLDRVILTQRAESSFVPPPQPVAQNDPSPAEDEPLQPLTPPAETAPRPPQFPPNPTPESRPADDNTPDQ